VATASCTHTSDTRHVVSEPNLSVAWLKAFTLVTEPGVDAIAPAVVTVTGFVDSVPQEIPSIAVLIDAALAEHHHRRLQQRPSRKHLPKSMVSLTCNSVANTIFPTSLWSPGASRQTLYERYRRIIPQLKRDPRNRRGTYFERLINFGRGPSNGNQLEQMIECSKRGVRRVSAFQASLYDPARDSTRLPQQGFPCLQQIAVHPDKSHGTLAITGFYATQYLFERAYGNYLGLCRLGRFLAHEMNLTLTRMTCVASYSPLYGITKERARRLAMEAAQAARATTK
jgi:hypothetical protein